MAVVTDRERAWAAGLFEGEGTVRISKATRRNLGHLVVSVVNTDVEVVRFFQSRWPGYFKPATGLNARQRPAWVWVCAARRAAAFLRDISGYLVTRRVVEKATVGIQFQESKLSSRLNRTDGYREEQFNAYLWMRELNVRGACPDAKDWRRR